MAPINDPVNAAFGFRQNLLLIVLAIRKVVAWSADFSKYDLSFNMSVAVCFLY